MAVRTDYSPQYTQEQQAPKIQDFVTQNFGLQVLPFDFTMGSVAGDIGSTVALRGLPPGPGRRPMKKTLLIALVPLLLVAGTLWATDGTWLYPIPTLGGITAGDVIIVDAAGGGRREHSPPRPP